MKKTETSSRREFLKTAAISGGAAAGLSAAAKPPAGFRSLFDGKTLKGWRATPRLPVPNCPGGPAPKVPAETLARIEKHVGKWVVEDRAIVGGQDLPGSGIGAYLVSDERFAAAETPAFSGRPSRTGLTHSFRTSSPARSHRSCFPAVLQRLRPEYLWPPRHRHR